MLGILYSGLVSVTFRELSPKDIIALVRQAGLQAIEWGGDIHVPHGNVKRAGDVFRMTQEAGLRVASYGSYYIVGCEEQTTISFEQVLETAEALKAPTIRVWAGNRGSKEADEAWRNRVVEESHRIVSLAEKSDIVLAFEYHNNTLTDTSESACQFMKAINHKNAYSCWQIPDEADVGIRTA